MMTEYASTVWDPHTQKNIHKLDMIQRRAARYACNRYHNIFKIHFFFFFSNLNLSRIKRTTVEISVLILSCVILGLNPVLPVLLFFFFFIS